jgi:conjugative transposon TraM protein
MQPILYSPKFLKHRKFLLILPVIILPFLVLLFIILGGGKASSEGLSPHSSTGLNVRLPDAQFKKGGEKSKLSLYEEASKDSILLKEKIKNDPYYEMEPHDTMGLNPSGSDQTDQHAARVMEQLAVLKSVLQHKKEGSLPNIQAVHSSAGSSLSPPTQNNLPILGSPKSHNPDIDQLNSLLDKVMAVQHPEMVRDSLSGFDKSRNEAAFHVGLNPVNADVETFGSIEETKEVSFRETNRFYDLATNQPAAEVVLTGIEAAVAETQVLVSGSTVKLRLLDDIRIGGHLISKDQFIYGIASLGNERLKIQFSSIRSGNHILPVSLEAYDLDGLTGIYIPGSLDRDVAKQSGDQALSAMALTSLDPSIGAQAAGAGIQAAKSLLSKKIKLIKVTVRAGYRVLLKDTKQ